MTSLATFNFKISQLYPGAGEHKLNTCGNPDCTNFGASLTEHKDRRAEGLRRHPDLTPEQLDGFEENGPGAYKLSGASKKHRRVSRVFNYENEPHAWIDHRLSHDDLSFSVNWETATDPGNTQLNCSITADATSGYVYRIDFDPRVAPLDLSNSTYLDEHGGPQNLSKEYPDTKTGSAPLFSWQRPTGCLHEPQFFSACVNELEAFKVRARRRVPHKSEEQQVVREELTQRINGEMERIRIIGEDWFGFRANQRTRAGRSKE